MFDLASDRCCCKPSTTVVVSQVSTVVNEVRRSEPWAAIPGGDASPSIIGVGDVSGIVLQSLWY